MALIDYTRQRRPVNTTQPVARTDPYAPPPAPAADAPANPYSATDFGGGDPVQQQRQITDARAAAAPLGFDARKWGDPTQGTSHKYLAGTTLAASGSIGDVLRRPEFQGWTQVSGDKIRSPEGNIYDEYYDYGGPHQRVQHTLVGGPRWEAEQNNGYQGNVGGVTGIGTAAGNAMRAPGGKLAGYPNTPGVQGNSASSYMAAFNGANGAMPGGYTAQFGDPSTRQFEAYLMQQMQALEAQRTAQGQANVGLRGQMTDAQGATKRLTDFLGQRASQLQQPAYTGAEQEILRTQMLDPIERDRTAANKRALENVGSRGFDPTSGVAQELFGQVNRGFDERRAAAQGDLAYRQINEKRSREQEAQALLGAIPGIQRGAGGADLQYLQMLDAAMNKPREQGINLSQQLYRLPAQAQADALQAMGMGGSPDALFNNAMQLYNAQNQQGQYQDQQNAQYWQMLGNMLPYLTGQGGTR
jgi:hypothetical protein